MHRAADPPDVTARIARSSIPGQQESYRLPSAATSIERFLDYYWIRHGVSSLILTAYRNDLQALDRWMVSFRGRTLVTALEQDIREFLAAAYRGEDGEQCEPPSLSCIKRFYAYLRVGGLRSDDPTDNVFVRTPRPAPAAAAY
jgi:integrase/recombinase XerD